MLGLSSCNPGIFIEPLDADRREYVLPFTGGTAEVELTHGDWEVDRVAVGNVDIDARLGDDGVLRHESGFMSFSLSRPSERTLRLVLERSTDPDTVEIGIHISNDFQTLEVPVAVGACRGYSFDRIEYGTVTGRVEDYEEAWTETVDSPAASEWEADVFDERFGRTLRFPAASVTSPDMPEAMWMDELMKYVGQGFEVRIPSPFHEEGDMPELCGRTEFTYKEVFIAMGNPSEKVTLTLNEGRNVIRMQWGYVAYRIPYTIWLSHPDGRPMSFSGELVSKAHDGRWRVER